MMNVKNLDTYFCVKSQAWVGNQVQEIEAAGFSVSKQRTITKAVSGSIAASERKGFFKLLGKFEDGDVLVVTKLDQLGEMLWMSGQPSNDWPGWESAPIVRHLAE
jgi:DNA invertase Pin-like site-specific DNA recombinase